MRNKIIIAIILLICMLAFITSCTSRSALEERRVEKLESQQEDSSVSLLNDKVWYINKEFQIVSIIGEGLVTYRLYQHNMKCRKCYTFHGTHDNMKEVEEHLLQIHKKHQTKKPFIYN